MWLRLSVCTWAPGITFLKAEDVVPGEDEVRNGDREDSLLEVGKFMRRQGGGGRLVPGEDEVWNGDQEDSKGCWRWASSCVCATEQPHVAHP